MIYLIEGVLPESYFANNLRGLSVDMAVFRDLLRLRLPTLSRHLEQLQHDARDSATGKFQTHIIMIMNGDTGGMSQKQVVSDLRW
jgi:GTPase-activating protein